MQSVAAEESSSEPLAQAKPFPAWAVFWITLIIAVIAANLAWLSRNRLNGDVASILYQGREILHGMVLYKDYGDVNPPLAAYFMVPPAWLAEILHVPQSFLWFAAVWGMVVTMVWLSESLSRPFLSRSLFWPLMFLVIYRLGIVDRLEFSQRDELAAYATIPILLLSASRILGFEPKQRLAVGASLLAAPLIALKPFFLLPWVLLTVAPLVWSNWRQPDWPRLRRMPDAWIVPLAHLVYGLSILVFFPEFLAYAPLVLKYYTAYNTTLRFFIPLWPQVLWLVSISVILLTRFRKRVAWMSDESAVLCALSTLTAFAFLASAVVQRKGLYYHEIPFFLFCWITFVFAALGVVRSWRPKALRSSALFWVAALIGLALVTRGVVISAWDVAFPIYPPRLRQVIEKEADAKGVLFIAGDPWCVFPMLYESGKTMAGREGMLWMLPALYRDQIRLPGGHFRPPQDARYHSPSEMTGDEKNFFTDMRSVLAKSPKFVYLQIGQKQGLGNLRFDYEQYLSSDPVIASALKNYSVDPRFPEDSHCGRYCFQLLKLRQDAP